MALPTNRTAFKEYILRRLGFPVIEINVDEEQIEDRIDDALSYYQEYHFDGMEKLYLKHLITAEDKTNKYLTIPDDILSIVRVLPANGYGLTSSSGMFSVQYQIALNDLFNLNNANVSGYVGAMQNLELLNNIFAGESGIRFNRRTDKLYINHDWSTLTEGQYLVIECYKSLDPDEYSEIWSDRWLLRYATALVKRQYGEHLSKYGGIQMLGGVTFNGERILSDANAEIEKLEAEMINSYSLPSSDVIG